VSSFDTVAEFTALTSASRVWVPGPVTATMNLFAAVHARHVGASEAPEVGAATHAYLTPMALAGLLDDVDTRPLAGKQVVVAGDRLSPLLHDRAVAAGARVHHYYGAAELSFVAWGRHADDLRPFPGVDVDVRDGVIWVRSPYVCVGYHGPPGPLRRADDGFVTVGDRGRWSPDGRLAVLGRDEAVSVGGATVLVADVEPALRAAAVGSVVVLGLPNDVLGYVLAAVLTSPSDLAGCRDVARRSLEGAHRPRLWFHVDDLPVTPQGKVDRAALVSLLSGDDGRARRLV
jgi:acyl-CoA synthetase (AMP-forming)/AMP-acid ligase II